MRTRTHLPRLTGELSFELANVVSTLACVRMPARCAGSSSTLLKVVALVGPDTPYSSASGLFTNE